LLTDIFAVPIMAWSNASLCNFALLYILYALQWKLMA
jgi:hypothetical protein